jgi:hypothetical protein
MAPLGLYPTKLPPIILRAPGPGPEPLSTFEPMPKTGATWPIPTLEKKAKVSNIQDLWPQYQASADAKPRPTETAAKAGEHFPFASAGTRTDDSWPATALSYAPAAAGLPGSPFRPVRD